MFSSVHIRLLLFPIIRQFLNLFLVKKTILFILSFHFVIFLVSCNVTEVTPNKKDTQITLETLADGLGNKDGIVSGSEKDSIKSYFEKSEELWVIGAIKLEYRDSNVSTIKAIDLVEMFGMARLLGPWFSQTELADDFLNGGIQIPWVGVYVIKKENDIYYISRFFRAPGGTIKDVENWVEFTIE